MIALANTTADVYRDANTTDTDEWGDATETAGPPVVSGLPMSVIVQNENMRNGSVATGVSTDDGRVTTYANGRADRSADLRVGDLLVLADGSRWGVTQIIKPQSLGVLADQKVKLVAP